MLRVRQCLRHQPFACRIACRVIFPVRPSAQRAEEPRRLQHYSDVAAVIESGRCPGRHDAGGIVLFEDERAGLRRVPGPTGGRIGVSIQPCSLIRNRPGAAGSGAARRRLDDALAGRRRRPRAHPEPTTWIDTSSTGSSGAGAMAVGASRAHARRPPPDSATMLASIGPLGDRHGELEALPVVVQRRRAAQAGTRAGKALARQLRQRLAARARSRRARSRRDRRCAAAAGTCANSDARRRPRAGRRTEKRPGAGGTITRRCRARRPCRRQTAGRCRQRRTARTSSGIAAALGRDRP